MATWANLGSRAGRFASTLSQISRTKAGATDLAPVLLFFPVFHFAIYPHHHNISLQPMTGKGSRVADEKFTSTFLPHYMAAIRNR